MTGQKSGAPEGAEGAALITIPQAASLLMITEQWVRDLCRKGFIPRPERGKVPLVGAVRGYIRYLKDEERRSTQSAAAASVQQARADEIRLRIARETGELIDMQSTEEVFADILGTLRSRLAGVPAACTRDLTMRQTIETHLEDALSEAREDFDKRAAELRAPAKRRRK